MPEARIQIRADSGSNCKGEGMREGQLVFPPNVHAERTEPTWQSMLVQF